MVLQYSCRLVIEMCVWDRDGAMLGGDNSRFLEFSGCSDNLTSSRFRECPDERTSEIFLGTASSTPH